MPTNIDPDSREQYSGIMKTTVNIPDDVLKDAMRLTRATTKRDAIVSAMEDYIRRKRMAELVKYSGTSTTFLSNEEIEGLDRKRSSRVE